ncbi:MAG: hypothetical protein WC728_14475 [Elusimicrobiota bacterium]
MKNVTTKSRAKIRPLFSMTTCWNLPYLEPKGATVYAIEGAEVYAKELGLRRGGQVPNRILTNNGFGLDWDQPILVKRNGAYEIVVLSIPDKATVHARITEERKLEKAGAVPILAYYRE